MLIISQYWQSGVKYTNGNFTRMGGFDVNKIPHDRISVAFMLDILQQNVLVTNSNVNSQLDATVTNLLIITITSTCFGR